MPSIQQTVTDFVQGLAEPVATAEVAEALELPEANVKVYLSRGVQRGLLTRVQPGVFAAAVDTETSVETNGSGVSDGAVSLRMIDEGTVTWATLTGDETPPEATVNLQVETETETETTVISVEGVVAVEGEPTGDGRMIENGALDWDGVLPIALIWDRADGDHTGSVVGQITELERRDGGQIWGTGTLSASEDTETVAAVTRVRELLEEGAVGVSLRLDSVDAELRVRREALEEMPDDGETSEDGERIVVGRMRADDMLEVTTSARPRHVAIVDTAAFADARLAIAASGAITLAGDDRWSGFETWFGDPKFGEPGQDARLRYDPQTGTWSCPNTVDGTRVYGHVAPSGICLRGRPDRCINPPQGDLNGFMRHRAPAAGGERTGVICVGGGHAQTGVGVGEATRFYDQTGRAVADVKVGNDRYGIWFAGMLRPGATPEDVYAFEASDVSGHWEFDQRGRAVLVGLPAVNVGGFPKGYLTYEEVSAGVTASGSIDGDCGCGTLSADAPEFEAFVRSALARLEEAVAPLYAAHLSSLIPDDEADQ